MSQEQKIAFDNSVKGDPREERNIPQSRETDQRWRKRKCQKKRKMMFNR